MAPPFWVIGAPRSGTTFLARVLDHHPDIFLTNETRLMLLFSRLLNRSVDSRRLLATSKEEILRQSLATPTRPGRAGLSGSRCRFWSTVGGQISAVLPTAI